MGKKRILYYTDCPFFAGCENMIANFFNSEELSKEYDIVLVYRYSKRYEDGARTRMSLDRAIPVNLVSELPRTTLDELKGKPFFGLRRMLRNLVLWYRKYYSIRKNKKILTEEFKKINPDILHINNGGYPAAASCYAAVLAAKECGISNVVYVVNNMAADYKHPLRWFDRRLDHIVKKQVSFFINGSNNAGDRLKKVLSIHTHQQVTIRNGIVPREITMRKSEFRSLYGIDDDTFVFAEVANLEERKGHLVLLMAVEKLMGELKVPKFVVLLEGDGPLREKIASYIGEHELSEYVQMIEVKQIYSLYNAIDALILPSIHSEDFPNTIIEAMGQGLPVIGTKIAGIPEQIDDHLTGLLIPPRDPDALAKAMKVILADKDFYKFCSGNAKRKFEKNYTAQISVKNYMNLYDSM